jgi:hypothetical protein
MRRVLVYRKKNKTFIYNAKNDIIKKPEIKKGNNEIKRDLVFADTGKT